jgi:hypothetical protein
VPAGFLNALNANLPCDTAKRLSTSERQNYIDKVKLRNEQNENDRQAVSERIFHTLLKIAPLTVLGENPFQYVPDF